MIELLLYPLLVQVALTFVIGIRLAYIRNAVIRDPNVDLTGASYDSRVWPLRARLVANNFQNQFEIPVLFYVGIILSMVFEISSPYILWLAWLFALFRIAHAAIHLTSNAIRWRYRFFVIATSSVGLMWILIVYEALFSVS